MCIAAGAESAAACGAIQGTALIGAPECAPGAVLCAGEVRLPRKSTKTPAFRVRSSSTLGMTVPYLRPIALRGALLGLRCRAVSVLPGAVRPTWAGPVLLQCHAQSTPVAVLGAQPLLPRSKPCLWMGAVQRQALQRLTELQCWAPLVGTTPWLRLLRWLLAGQRRKGCGVCCAELWMLAVRHCTRIAAQRLAPQSASDALQPTSAAGFAGRYCVRCVRGSTGCAGQLDHKGLLKAAVQIEEQRWVAVRQHRVELLNLCIGKHLQRVQQCAVRLPTAMRSDAMRERLKGWIRQVRT